MTQKRKAGKKKKKLQKLNIMCWNMRSHVENDGSLKTRRVRQDECAFKGLVEKKAVLKVWELKRYNIFVAGISETKWFGNNIYEVEDHVILHPGRKLPEELEEAKVLA